VASITSLDALRTIYKTAKGRAVTKEMSALDKHAKRFIELSPFLTIGSRGQGEDFGDVSPRGDGPGFVHVLDANTIAIPDRPGNNRLDTLENILEQPEVGLLFLVPGVDETLRISGRAEIRDDDDLRARFEVQGRMPATVIVVHVRRAYLHCAKALMRSKLWDPAIQVDRKELPSMAQMIVDQTQHDPDVVQEPLESQEDMVKRYATQLY